VVDRPRVEGEGPARARSGLVAGRRGHACARAIAVPDTDGQGVQLAGWDGARAHRAKEAPLPAKRAGRPPRVGAWALGAVPRAAVPRRRHPSSPARSPFMACKTVNHQRQLDQLATGRHHRLCAGGSRERVHAWRHNRVARVPGIRD